MCIGTDGLVSDRLAEFRRLARSSGALPSADAGPPNLAGAGRPEVATSKEKLGKSWLLQPQEVAHSPKRPEAEGSFMREFFEHVSGIQATLKRGHACVQLMDGTLEQMLCATSHLAEKVASDSLSKQVEEAMNHLSAVKRSLEFLQAQSSQEDQVGPSEAQRRIRANLQRALANKHQQLLADFQRSQLSVKRALEQRQVRELQLLCPQATGEQVRDMVEAGHTSSQMMVSKMAGAHANILQEVQRIQEKHQDVLRLERSIAELAQMFQECAVLVDAQGELLDSIETSVHSTNEYVGKGVKELDTTIQVQANTRKWQCCLSCFCMVVLIVALSPMIFH